MKVVRYNDNIIVYLYDDKKRNDTINEMVKKIFKILKKYYNYQLNNSYNIKLYLNKYYGMIFEIKTYYNDITDNNVNVNIKVLKNSLFLYEVKDPLDYLDNEIYYYDDKFFINMKKTNISIYENSNIIYGKEVYKIIGSGIKI